MPTFSSYGIDFDGLVKELRKKGIPFTLFYEERFAEYLHQALKATMSAFSKLSNLLESYKSNYGLLANSA